MFVIMPYFANSEIVEGRFHHYSEIESTTDNIESSQYGRSIDYHLYPPSWRKFENRNFMSKSSRWPYWAADLVLLIIITADISPEVLIHEKIYHSRLRCAPRNLRVPFDLSNAEYGHLRMSGDESGIPTGIIKC